MLFHKIYHETVKIWGGWARGHKAVNITPKLVLKQYDDNMEQESKHEHMGGGDVLMRRLILLVSMIMMMMYRRLS